MARDIICSSLSRDEFRRIMHLCNVKLIWDRISDVYEGHRTCQDPWFLEFKESLKTMTFEPESSSSAPCLMAKGAKVLEYPSSSESSEKESNDDLKLSYSKLAN